MMPKLKRLEILINQEIKEKKKKKKKKELR
jgi:hypothetical protein